MSTADLRDAARLIRENAPKRLNVSPWIVSSDSVGDFCDVLDGADHWLAEASRSTGEHIASWHPAVALAVADWLDEHASAMDAAARDGIALSATPLAVAVAHAYLGQTVEPS